MSFGQDFLKGFFGPGDGLKDYAHASKTFLSNGYELAPRTKFLFHVYFTINTAVPELRAIYGSQESTTIGLMVSIGFCHKSNVSENNTFECITKRKIIMAFINKVLTNVLNVLKRMISYLWLV
jgi:hypothetical protein